LDKLDHSSANAGIEIAGRPRTGVSRRPTSWTFRSSSKKCRPSLNDSSSMPGPAVHDNLAGAIRGNFNQPGRDDCIRIAKRSPITSARKWRLPGQDSRPSFPPKSSGDRDPSHGCLGPYPYNPGRPWAPARQRRWHNRGRAADA